MRPPARLTHVFDFRKNKGKSKNFFAGDFQETFCSSAYFLRPSAPKIINHLLLSLGAMNHGAILLHRSGGVCGRAGARRDSGGVEDLSGGR